MAARVAVDYATVLAASDALQQLAARLASARPDDGFRAVSAAVAGGLLADAAAVEAGEWSREVAGLAASCRRYATALDTAVATYRDVDERLAP